MNCDDDYSNRPGSFEMFVFLGYRNATPLERGTLPANLFDTFVGLGYDVF
jgi:hypothetical protein